MKALFGPSSAASTAAASSSARSQRGAAARTNLQSELFIERRAEISGSLVCARSCAGE